MAEALRRRLPRCARIRLAAVRQFPDEGAAVVVTQGGIKLPGENEIAPEREIRAVWVIVAQEGPGGCCRTRAAPSRLINIRKGGPDGTRDTAAKVASQQPLSAAAITAVNMGHMDSSRIHKTHDVQAAW